MVFLALSKPDIAPIMVCVFVAGRALKRGWSVEFVCTGTTSYRLVSIDTYVVLNKFRTFKASQEALIIPSMNKNDF